MPRRNNNDRTETGIERQKWISFGAELVRGLAKFGLEEKPKDVKAWAKELAEKVSRDDMELFLESLSPSLISVFDGTKRAMGIRYCASFKEEDRELVLRILPALAVASPDAAANLLFRINSRGVYEPELDADTVRKLGKAYKVDISEILTNSDNMPNDKGGERKSRRGR